MVAAAAIAAAVAIVAALLWWTSDARATISRPATAPIANPTPAQHVPASLRQLWTAASPHTSVPVVAGGTVVTGDGGTIAGHDPVTGEQRWSFTRDLELCAVSWVYHFAVTVYPDGRGCGQVSTVEGTDGERGPTRSGYADKHIEVTSDGTTVLAAGDTRLELWRSDMVRMIGYGEVDARVKPGQTGLGAGCRLVSAAASSSAVSVLQACKDEADLRLTLLQPGDDDDEPKLRDVPEPGITPESGARVLAVSDTTTAVYLPLPQPHVSVVDDTGTEISSTVLAGPPTSADGPNSRGSDTVSKTGDLITWWTGDSLVAFDTGKLAFKYLIPAEDRRVPLGPGAVMASKLLVPVTGGLGVYDAATGVNERYIPVDRLPAPTAVVPAIVGSTIVEQRGDSIVALG